VWDAGGSTVGETDWLYQNTRKWIQELQDKPWDGPVRYLLFRFCCSSLDPTDVLELRNARPWPLAEDPDSIAVVPSTVGGKIGTSRLATGQDADKLRALRDALLSGAIGCDYCFAIPIAGAGGKYYQLYVRDSIPLEDEHGLLGLHH